MWFDLPAWVLSAFLPVMVSESKIENRTACG